VNSVLNAKPDLRKAAGHERSITDNSFSVSATEGYKRWAPIYDDAPNPLLAREERYLLPLLADLGDKSVLDLACGTGRWLKRTMELGCKRGAGIDRSMAMLRFAAEKSAIRQRLAEADCASLPFSSAAFDLAICSFALGHIGNLEMVVRELARVTRPAADIFVSDLHPEAYARGWRVGFRQGDVAVQIETQYRSVEEVVAAFCSNGFECQTQASLWLGEPEEALFVRAGKSRSFVDACQLPAVLVCHFRRGPDEARL
jgi:ubiquinone/menaquinone biosynthesis C-methylase UbiE